MKKETARILLMALSADLFYLPVQKTAFNGTVETTAGEENKFKINVNQSLTIKYEATLNQGTLLMTFLDGKREVWSKTLSANDAATVTIPKVESGQLHLQVQGNEAAGAFSVE